MKITIVERKMHASEELRDYTTKKLSKLERYFHKDTSAVVTFSEIKGRQTAEITVRHGGMVFRAEETTTDMFASVDGMISSIERQIRKNKTRLARRLRQDAFSRTVEETSFIPQPEEDDISITKVKTFYMRPMTREEAVLQMELLNHSFFAFRDTDHGGSFAVVYKRNDGGYGLIDDTE